MMGMEKLIVILKISSVWCLLLGCEIIIVEAAPKASLIKSLPGFNGTFPSKHYSGYVTINGDIASSKNLFYYFVVSERNPRDDPVVLWLNGGPGCSSFDGFVYEHGPFNFEAGKTEGSLPKLHLNPYSWSKVSNMIYLDSPAGVGFSYSKNTTIYKTGDLQTAFDTHDFLIKWFNLYPEFVSNPFYIAGESYGGVYVPTLTSQVLKGLIAGEKPIINLKGYIVGNGVADEIFDGNGLVPFAHGMALISDEMYEEAMTSCKGNYYNPPNYKCEIAVEKINVDDTVATVWLNNDAVRKAIHVNQGSGSWSLCTSDLLYNGDAGSIIPYHKNLTAHGYRALIYSGDHDMCVPYTGSQAWTRSVGYKIIDEWRPWMTNDQVAGYTQGYDNGLTFLTIKGAGHTVPEYKPREALHFYSNWLEGKQI
ncbi:Serine carboxypeptidase-like 7 [Camellia lanceoleosa]|uniref:Serine carboxypeptidase-like 7 n=1 Tax=Camellia lanceoleosa TaxID=1840588 RepID=A0ACC0IYG5_9ERIC|nr:Serine carboxypeptidase-like 7 [Camellia lanceoleosa]